MSSTRRRWNSGTFWLLILLSPQLSSAVEECDKPVGLIVSAQGSVDVRRADASVWEPAKRDDVVCPGDMVRVAERSRASVSFYNEGIIRIDQNTSLRLLDHTSKERSFMDVLTGVVNFFSRRPHTLDVKTPFVNAAIEGTEFLVAVSSTEALITVLEGTVVAVNNRGRVQVESGEMVSAPAGKPPTKSVVVKTRSLVQWTLYYPPILAVLADRSGMGKPVAPKPLTQAIALGSVGDYSGAFVVLDRFPDFKRDADFHVYRAALLLNVGRADEALDDIDSAVAKDPSAALAWSLRGVIALILNQRDQALGDARKGVALDPRSAAAKIALSYALQATLRLDDARKILQQTVEQNPDDALAWARLSELQLMSGYRRQALKAADRAKTLAPDIARVWLAQGFAALGGFRHRQAADYFLRSIELDSADPMARLGLGLAKIRSGELEHGRREIDIAAGVDPGSSIVRSYLGKAYFEERRENLAGREFQRAKELDPLDPTPYLYDGILKQSTNRPVEGLAEVERSIELNDRRAVYRGQLLLDEDRAARGSSLGRIYNDLGFGQLGINEATRSLALDPSSASGHRFLSDLYQNRPRVEVTRVSELLRAQLLQDININPVQPSIAQTDLNIIASGGPTSPGFNEFTPLFERNGAQLNLSGLGGSNETYGGEGVISGIYDRVSFSAGHFHYQSDGFRPNNDNEEDITNLFAQVAVTPEFNFQAEYRHRRNDQGDLSLNFDPEVFSPRDRRRFDADTVRLGARFSPTPSSDLLLSTIYVDREEQRSKFFEFPGRLVEIKTHSESDGYQLEGQYIFRKSRWNLVAGGGTYQIDRTDTLVGLFGPDVKETDEDQNNLYAYGNLEIPSSMTWTLGASYDSVDSQRVSIDRMSPKVGLQWHISDGIGLRAAYFRAMKRAIAAEQTLEPTQVAGFNQFFDDINFTKTENLGVGLDIRPSSQVYMGVEFRKRDLEHPVVSASTNQTFFYDRNEKVYRAYAYWTPSSKLALSADVFYEEFSSDPTGDPNLPTELDTLQLPVSVRYFHPSGLIGMLTGTYVDQDLVRAEAARLPQGSDNFFILDAGVGYRLPNRRGILSIEGQNLFDTQFSFQGDQFRNNRAVAPPFAPERRIFGRLTLNF